MRLTRVTITGADDAVSYDDIWRIQCEFPFVEFGLLLSATKEGEPRYPSARWLRALPQHIDTSIGFSAHVCGARARALLVAGQGGFPCHFERAQVNGFSTFDDKTTAFEQYIEATWAVEFILQLSDISCLPRAEAIASRLRNVSALVDLSGGAGIPIREFPVASGGMRLGYAGGIGPDNVVDVLARMNEKLPAAVETWIDMETGVRTNDVFDLDKVRRVLELTAPYIVGKERDRAS